jgi:serine/threonine protein kinase/ankyrin repeat protein
MLPGVYLPGDNPASSVRWESATTLATRRIDGPHGASTKQTDNLSPLVHLVKFMVLNEGEKENGYLSCTTAMNEDWFSNKNLIVGEGHHFLVYSAPFRNKDDIPNRAKSSNPEVYCIKSPNPASREEAGFREEICETVLQELKVLCHPKIGQHENIIRLFGIDFSTDFDDPRITWPCLMMEYSEFGTLESFLSDQGGVDFSLSRHLLLDVALGIQCLHDYNVVHGDVKSENVLVFKHTSRKYIAKVADFGLSVINPNPATKHYLLGSTWMWEAPECHSMLSVDGLKLTDVYSFGLVAWRVLLNHSIPYEHLGAHVFQRHRRQTRDEFIRAVKMDPAFQNIVAESVAASALPQPAKQVGLAIINSTLSTDPIGRSLHLAIRCLDDRGHHGHTSISMPNAHDDSCKDYWAIQNPSKVLEALFDAYPEGFLTLRTRPSALLGLLAELEPLTRRSGQAGFIATQLAFRFATSPEITCGDKSPEYVCELYMRLCKFESLSHISSLPFYYRMVNKQLPSDFSASMLEDAAEMDIYMAKKALASFYPESYQAWLREYEAKALSHYQEYSPDMLFMYLRLGNYEHSIVLLNTGVLPFTETYMPSAIHHLVSFSEQTEIHHLAQTIISSGGVLDEWWEDQREDCLLSAHVQGTPLHWACAQRNIAMVKVLCDLDTSPDRRNVDRAFLIAAAMHFDDVLDILARWIMRPTSTPTQLAVAPPADVWSAVVAAGTSAHYYLPRLLRHGPNMATEAMVQTLNVLLGFIDLEYDLQYGLLSLAISSGNAPLLKYLIEHFDVVSQKKKWEGRLEPMFSASILFSHYHAFEVLLDTGLISPKQHFLEGQLTALQVCGDLKQRNPAFVRKLLDMGCHPDELGPANPYGGSPFTLSVILGLYDSALLLLERGADKEFSSGWMGGQSPLVSPVLFRFTVSTFEISIAIVPLSPPLKCQKKIGK